MSLPRPFVSGVLKDIKNPTHRYKLYANRQVDVGRALLERAYQDRYDFAEVHCRIRTTTIDHGSRFDAFVLSCADGGIYVNDSFVPNGAELRIGTGDLVTLVYQDKPNLVFACAMYQPGTLASEFSKLRLIGKGAYGEVYEYVSRLSGIHCAVKSVRNVVKPGDHRNRVADELYALRKLKHRNIIAMDAYQCDAKHVYMMLEYARYGDVGTLMKQAGGTLPEGVARKISHDVASALRYMNRYLMIHRDIKPANILVSSIDPEVVVKVSDFGFARIMTGNTVIQTFCGTMSYMAPEIFKNGGCATAVHYDARVDSWSLGVMTFVMLAGRLPFEKDQQIYDNDGRDRADKRTAVSWERIPAGVTATAKKFIRDLVVFNPKHRLNAAAILDHNWLQGR